jgi:starch synthase (maltosyl-transferring)
MNTNIPLIYNLFPRLAGPLDHWGDHFHRVAAMGFNWLYLNPVFYPGFSGSLYAVKDFRRLDPVLVEGDSSLSMLRPILAQAKAAGLAPMVDLVINHTAKDSELVHSHPEWYCRDERGDVQSPWAIDPADARRKTVWGDLAELDHAGTRDPEGLRRFLEDIVELCLEVGFEGFRCDAAYKVPAATWAHLTAFARQRFPQALFMAETLGCRPEEMEALAQAGFDCVMNSSKYWAFDAPWCLDQHRDWQAVAPSVAFPETHDTPRLAEESGGSEAVQRQRFLFAACFSQGLLMPLGYEYGFRQRLNVVTTRNENIEAPYFDLQGFISQVLRLKREHTVLAAEGAWQALTSLHEATLILEKTEGAKRVLLLVNKDWHSSHEISGDTVCSVGGNLQDMKLIRPCLDDFRSRELPPTDSIQLAPAEIALILQ